MNAIHANNIARNAIRSAEGLDELEKDIATNAVYRAFLSYDAPAPANTPTFGVKVGEDDVWTKAARRIMADGEVSTHIPRREDWDGKSDDAELNREEKRVTRHVAALLYGYFPEREAVRGRRENAAADLLAALVPHVERLIEADLRPRYCNIPVDGSLSIKAFQAERLLANEESVTLKSDEQLLLLQNYQALHRTVSLLEAIERDPACIWRIASGRAA